MFSRGGDDGRFCVEAPGDGIVVLLELSPLRNGLLKLPIVRFSGDEGLPEDCGLGCVLCRRLPMTVPSRLRPPSPP